MVIDLAKHRWKHCGADCNGCMLCHGGLALCEICGGLEGALPTDCPGTMMPLLVCDEVYAGNLDYRRCEGWQQRPSRTWGRSVQRT